MDANHFDTGTHYDPSGYDESGYDENGYSKKQCYYKQGTVTDYPNTFVIYESSNEMWRFFWEGVYLGRVDQSTITGDDGSIYSTGAYRSGGRNWICIMTLK
jgi:hypothetical protein